MGAVAVKMGFIKVVKNKAYFKRFQVKYKRRREGKTDYYARKRLVTQDKNKFGTPKYRFVVRFTNKDIICQVVSSKLKGDICHTAAYAHELPRYGLSVGLTNYSAAYCVGLLCARRLLQKYGLDEKFEGTEEVTAEFEDCFVHNEDDDDEDGPKAFHALLDGGLEIPHNEKKFYGYDPDEGEYDAESNRERILGGHVSQYMESMQEEEPEEYEEKFKKYIEAGIEPDGMEDLYLGVHKAIREDPAHKPTEKKKPADLMAEKRDGGIRYTDEDGNAKFINRRLRTLQQRKNRVQQKKDFVLNTLAGDDDDEEEDEE